MKSVLKNLEQAKKAWHEQYPYAHGTPWDSCNKLEFNNETSWLNPRHQQHLNYGSVTEQQIQDWVDGKPGRIIKSQELWDELLYMCKIASASIIGLDIEHFNMYPAEYLLAPGQVYHPHGGEQVIGIGFPKRKQLPKSRRRGWEPRRLSHEMIKAVEGHVKWLIHKDFEDQMAYGNVDPGSIRIHQTTQEEIYGFMYALRALGLETCAHGYSNTPAIRENFAWWRNLLQEEARWELLIEKGLAYEPWLKNKKSTYSYVESREQVGE